MFIIAFVSGEMIHEESISYDTSSKLTSKLGGHPHPILKIIYTFHFFISLLFYLKVDKIINRSNSRMYVKKHFDTYKFENQNIS